MEQANPQAESRLDEADVSDLTNSDGKTTASTDARPLSRRSTLAGLAGLAGVGLLTGSASGQGSGGASGKSSGAIYDWQQDVDANGYALTELGSLSLTDSPTAIRDLIGANLSVTNGVLHTSLWDTDVDAAKNSLLNVEQVETASLRVSNVGASVYSDAGGEFFGGGSTIKYDTVRFDHRDEFDIDNHQFTASRPGSYQVSAAAGINSAIAGESIRITIRVNGTAEVRTEAHASSENFLDVSASKLLELSEGDTVKAILSGSGSGGARTYLGGRANTWMTIHQVG